MRSGLKGRVLIGAVQSHANYSQSVVERVFRICSDSPSSVSYSLLERSGRDKGGFILNRHFKTSFLIGCCCIIGAALANSFNAFAGSHTTTLTTSQRGLVVACEPLAAQIGADILRRGGNAAEAYIATTLAEYVTAYGYTSLSGPLYVLYYDVKTKKSSYLNAGLNTVQDPEGQSKDKNRNPGIAYVVGGAGRGLEALFQKFKGSKFNFSDLSAPAVSLARKGFSISPTYAATLQAKLEKFKGSAAWMSVYTRNGKTLSAGETLLQPELAKTLERFGKEGADYLYKGAFAESLVRMIRSQGGKLQAQDLASYSVNWSDPLETKYRGFKVQTSSYRSFGGFELLLSLKILENEKNLKSGAHFSEDEQKFETMLRAHLFGLNEAFKFVHFEKRLETNAQMSALLEGSLPFELFKKVKDKNQQAPMANFSGHHSCNPVVIDREGSVATGVHTINTLPWGEYGWLVDGVSINTARAVAMDAPPGVRALDSVNPVLVFQNDKPVVAAGFFASGLSQSAFQVVVNLLDYGMSPKAALEAPRYGSITDYKNLTMLLDDRYPKSWVDDFSKKGIRFSQPKGYTDTGMAMVIQIDSKTGLRTGSPTELVPTAIAVAE